MGGVDDRTLTTVNASSARDDLVTSSRHFGHAHLDDNFSGVGTPSTYSTGVLAFGVVGQGSTAHATAPTGPEKEPVARWPPAAMK